MSLTYPYTPTVPQGNQQINNTQMPIKNNFQDIYDLLAVNHVAFNTPDTFGRHTLVSYVEQGVDPSTLSTEMALYSKSVTNDANGAELFYRYPSNGNIVQLTGVTNVPTGGSSLTSGGTFTAGGTVAFGYAIQGYWQYLSDGILFMVFNISNYVQTPTSSPYVFNFPSGSYSGGVTVPTFTQTPFNVQLASNSSNQGTLGQDVNYAVTLTNNTSGLLYYNGPIITGSTINTVTITLIGI